MYYLIRGEDNSWYTKKKGKEQISFPSVELAIKCLQSYSSFKVSETDIDEAIIDSFSYDKRIIKFTETEYKGCTFLDLKMANWGKYVDSI